MIFFREKKSKSEKSDKKDRKKKEEKKSPKKHENDLNENEIEVIEVKMAKPSKRKLLPANEHDVQKLSTDKVQTMIKALLKDLVHDAIDSKGIKCSH